MKFRFLLILALISSFMACENTLEDYQPSFGGKSFFPLEVGHSWIYQLDSIVYDNNGTRIDTISSQIREQITEKFTDQSGNEAYRISRARLKGTFWKVTDIWSASTDERLAYRTEENLRFAKLSFPIIDGNSWDGNAFLDEEVIVKIAGEPIRVYQNWGDYRYEDVNAVETIGDVSYDKVCTVSQVDLEDKITKRYSLEKYVDGFGLVYKQMYILNTQKFESNDPWEIKAEEGFILEQTLLSFEPGG